MSFNRQDGALMAEAVSFSAVAESFGTPCYVYSRASIESSWKAYDEAFGDQAHRIFYSVKANSNLAVLDVLARLGSSFDIVSGGELARVLSVGIDPADIVFSGVGKQAEEMRHALDVGIACFNVESSAELQRLNHIAVEMDVRAPISLRVNPDVDAKTHPYISTGLKENKFGVDFEQAPAVYREAAAMANIEIVGIDCHIGSQLTELQPFVDALDRVLVMIDQLQSEGIALQHIDLGGGLGIRYQQEQPPSHADYVQALCARLQGRKLVVYIEPGRSIVGNAGVLLTQVEYLKMAAEQAEGTKNFVIVDAAMNDLARPSLYGAWHDIEAVNPQTSGSTVCCDVVGPVCETGDFLGKDRLLNVREGDLLAVMSAGAYGFVMSSNYNTRRRAAEVMVDGERVYLVRERETLSELYRNESMLPGD